MRIAQHIEINQRDHTVSIDGELFPFTLADESVHINYRSFDAGTVFLPVLADRVTFVSAVPMNKPPAKK